MHMHVQPTKVMILIIIYITYGVKYNRGSQTCHVVSSQSPEHVNYIFGSLNLSLECHYGVRTHKLHI